MRKRETWRNLGEDIGSGFPWFLGGSDRELGGGIDRRFD